MPRRLLSVLLGFIGGAPAAADTIIPGGNLLNHVWTPAGSPYIVQGDAVVPAGSTLTIQSGVVVRFAASDSQAAGLDPARVELTINGTLDAQGTASQPIAFRAVSGTTPGTWYGLVIGPASVNATLTHATIQHAREAVRSSAPGGVLQASNLLISASSQTGISLLAGAPALNALWIDGAGIGVSVSGDCSPIFTNCIVANCAQYGFLIQGQSGRTTRINCCTLDTNFNGVSNQGSGHTVVLTNSIISRGGGQGLARAAAATLDIIACDVWGNAGGDYSAQVPAGPGCCSVDPRYTGPGNYTLQPTSSCIDYVWIADFPGSDFLGVVRPTGRRFDLGALERTPPVCYSNCDGSTTAPTLNVNDFQCFLNRFATGDPWANCDLGTVQPVLNVNDFQCFLNLFASGCP